MHPLPTACTVLLPLLPSSKYLPSGKIRPDPSVSQSVKIPTCFHASFFPFCPLCWPPLFLPSSRHLLPFSPPSKSALFCRVRGTAHSLERGSVRMDLSTKFGKEIPSRNLREKISGLQKGPAERGHVKNRQKSSKNVKKFFDTFFSTIFARHQFSGPFWGALKKGQNPAVPT